MEVLVVVAALAFGALAVIRRALAGQDTSTTPEHSPELQGLMFVRLETVKVSRPEEMAEAIARVVRDRTNNILAANYVVGTPQVSADGLSANVPLYRQP